MKRTEEGINLELLFKVAWNPKLQSWVKISGGKKVGCKLETSSLCQIGYEVGPIIYIENFKVYICPEVCMGVLYMLRNKF